MKITKQELAQLIKEELDTLSREESVVPGLHHLETSPLNPESWEAIDAAARMKERGQRGQLQVDAPPIDLSRPMPAQVDLPSQELKPEDIGIWESLPDWAKVAIMVGGAGALQYGMSKIPSRKPRWEEQPQQPQMPHIRHGKSQHQVGQLKGDDLFRHLSDLERQSGTGHAPGLTGVATKLQGQRTDDFWRRLQALDPENFPSYKP